MKHLKHIITVLLVLISFSSFSQTADTILVTSSAKDPNGFAMTFNWTQISGQAATIVTPNSNNTVLRGVKEGTSIFRVKVTNDHGAASTKDITVEARRNQAPIITAESPLQLVLPEK